jgi:hypothetical protein
MMHPEPTHRPTAYDILEHGHVVDLGLNIPDSFILNNSNATEATDVVKQQLFAPTFYNIVS